MPSRFAKYGRKLPPALDPRPQTHRRHAAKVRGSARKQRQLLEQFLEAVRTGNMDQLLSVLSDDAVLYADGGGKGFAPPEPVRGASNVARGADTFRELIEHGLVPRIAEINGEPGIVTYINGKPHSAMTIRTQKDRIQTLYLGYQS